MCDDELTVEPSMKLMDDLLEESLNMLDLQFRLDRRFGVRIPGMGNFAGIETDEEGRFTSSGLAALRAVLPDSLLDRFQDPASRPTAKELWYAMTVQDLVNLVDTTVAKETKNAKQAAAGDS